MCDVARSHYLYGFECQKTLSEDLLRKSIVLFGRAPAKGKNGEAKHPEEAEEFEDVILIIEKLPLDESFTDCLYGDIGDFDPVDARYDEEIPLKVTREVGENDVYRWCEVDIGVGETGYKATVIRPATAAHVRKYTKHELVMVTETPDLYTNSVLPWIESQPIERVQWVYNILDKKKEADTILYEHADRKQGYIIIPDMKWDGTTVGSLYLVAIVHDRSLRSLRDLTIEHVPMLQSILEQGTQIARDRYGLQNEEHGTLRCFIHYHPTYYHFHVHLLSANYDSHPGAVTGQAHLLQDVIDLLKLGVDFRKRTLTYSMAVNHPLFQHLYPSDKAQESAAKKPRLQ
jgi:m7GpppX diphosphatase